MKIIANDCQVNLIIYKHDSDERDIKFGTQLTYGSFYKFLGQSLSSSRWGERVKAY